jgi:hypothetical protein
VRRNSGRLAQHWLSWCALEAFDDGEIREAEMQMSGHSRSVETGEAKSVRGEKDLGLRRGDCVRSEDRPSED